MIDEKKLIEIIKEQFPLMDANHVVKSTLMEVIDIINNQPQVQQWVPCRERPPKEAVEWEMNCWVYGFTDFGAIVPTFYKDGCFHDEKSEPVSEYEIIAWMPLPEPYKKEGESNGSN